jgi:hypothetical protein
MELDYYLNNIFNAIFAPGWISGVFWNVVVSLFVIWFTVYFVDKRAKKREDERWQPAKDNIYYNLFWSLTTIVHFLRLSNKWKENKYYHYHFGEYFVATRYDVANLKHQEVDFTNNSPELLSPYAVSKLEDVSKKIDDLMNNYPQLFEPDLLGQLLRLKESLEPNIAILNRHLASEQDRQKNNIDLSPMIKYVFSLLVWLSNKARVTIEHSDSTHSN